MGRRGKEPELTFICPNCNKSPEPNANSNKNFNCYDMVCPDCNVRYDWYLDSKKIGE